MRRKRGISLWLVCLALLLLSFAPGVQSSTPVTPRGRLVIAFSGVRPTLDPHQQGSVTFEKLQLFDMLVTLSPTLRSFVPWLAESWKVVDDSTWRFKLRKDVFFHNGERFNAQAVRFSLERQLKEPAKVSYRGIVGARVVDEFTVDIKTDGPFPALLSRLATLAIIPPAYTRKYGSDYFSTNPVGTGPFKLKEFVRDSHILLEVNEKYWTTLPRIQELQFRSIPDSTTRIAALLSGEVHIAEGVPDRSAISRAQAAGHRFITYPAMRYNFAFLRGDAGPLKDKRVRQAVNYAIDRDTIVRSVFNGWGRPIATVTLPLSFGHDPKAKPYPYDPDQARTLLKEAGFSEGRGLRLVIETPKGRYPFDLEAVEAIAAYLNDVGIRTEVRINEWGRHLDKYFNRGISDIFYISSGGPALLDASGSFERGLTSSNLNYWNTSKEVDKVILQAAAELNFNKRLDLYRDLTRIWLDEAPEVFLWNYDDLYLVRREVRGFAGAPQDYFRLGGVFLE